MTQAITFTLAGRTYTTRDYTQTPTGRFAVHLGDGRVLSLPPGRVRVVPNETQGIQ